MSCHRIMKQQIDPQTRRGRPLVAHDKPQTENGRFVNRPYDQISAENLFSLPICVIMEWVMDMEENHVGATIGRPPRTLYPNIIASVGEGLTPTAVIRREAG